MDNNELLDNLKLIVGDTQVRIGEPMNIHTTFRIGGCADYYVQPSSIEELQSLIRFLNKSDIEQFAKMVADNFSIDEILINIH